MRAVSKRHVLLCYATLFATVAASRGARAEDWGSPGLDAAHGRLSSERSGSLFAAGRWSFRATAGARVLASPVTADGYLVSIDLEGVVRGFRSDDGRVVWQRSVASPVHGTPAIANGRVFVPTLGGSVVALRLSDGALLWTKAVGGMTLSSPTAIDGDILVSVGAPGKSVVRLAGASGETVWQTPPVMEQFGNTSPAVDRGLVVVGSNGGRYYGFDAASGRARWTYAGDGIVHLAAPLIADGRVYVAGGNDSDRVHAIDAATGVTVPGWPITLPTPAPDIAGTRRGRQRAVSSFASVGGLLLFQTRLDDALDTNGDGTADLTLSREWVLALDSSGAVVWQMPRARAEIGDPNLVPKFFVCPTPAAFIGEGRDLLAVAASSLDATLLVIDAKAGLERARHAVAGPALASPMMANGNLYVAATDGTIEALASSTNHAPGQATAAANLRPLDSGRVVLSWMPAIDRDGEKPGYELRIDADGEVLSTWQQRVLLPAGATSAEPAGGFVPGVSYTFALRARDARGAAGPWSKPGTFTVIENPAVTVDGRPAASLAAALAGARPGEVVMLGAGLYTLTDTVRVGGGVTLMGAGPGRTRFDASGLPTGIVVAGADGGRGTVVDGISIEGADTCLEVASQATAVRITHVIARDCRVDAIAIAAGGEASMANVTVVGSGVGVRVLGAARIKNSILSGNDVGLASENGGTLISSYNDVTDSPVLYRGLSAGSGDLTTAVTFADFTQRDLRILVTQATTDRGDPSDDASLEPAPNGGRVNLGAFGGTADAEISAVSTIVGGSAGTPPAPTVTTRPDHALPNAEVAGGSAGCSTAGAPESPGWLWLVGLLSLLVRNGFCPIRAPSGRARSASGRAAR